MINICSDCTDINVRIAAANKLIDKSIAPAQKVFIEVVKNKELDIFTRKEAVKHLNDELLKRKMADELKLEEKKWEDDIEKNH